MKGALIAFYLASVIHVLGKDLREEGEIHFSPISLVQIGRFVRYFCLVGGKWEKSLRGSREKGIEKMCAFFQNCLEEGRLI